MRVEIIEKGKARQVIPLPITMDETEEKGLLNKWDKEVASLPVYDCPIHWKVGEVWHVGFDKTGRIMVGELVNPVPLPVSEANFYCKEYDKNGYTCEEQCSVCKKASGVDADQLVQKAKELIREVKQIDFYYERWNLMSAIEKLEALFPKQ